MLTVQDVRKLLEEGPLRGDGREVIVGNLADLAHLGGVAASGLECAGLLGLT